MQNYEQVLHQMQEFGIELRQKDLPLKIDTKKRITCGAKSKDWYRLYEFRPDAGGSYITGSFGTYRHGGSWQKVEVDWKPLSDAERERMARERAAKAAAAAAGRELEIANARLNAAQHWRQGQREGGSPYLERKGVQGEACRYLVAQLVLRWPGDRGEPDTVVRLPAGTLMVPMIRYDLPREEALRGIQFIRPDGQKVFLRGFDKPGTALRLGEVDDFTPILLVVEGYATGLTVRTAIARRLPVFVAFDAGNLAHVVPLLRDLHPDVGILICADDDWQTREQRTQKLINPGRTAAKAIAKQVPGVDIVYPVFDDRKRGRKQTDFDDLRTLQGLEVVTRQLENALTMMERVHG